MNKRSIEYVPHTCPKIDKDFGDTLDSISELLDNLLTSVKINGTEKLRKGLDEVISDSNYDIEEKDLQIRELNYKLDELETLLEEKNNTIFLLETEIEKLQTV